MFGWQSEFGSLVAVVLGIFVCGGIVSFGLGFIPAYFFFDKLPTNFNYWMMAFAVICTGWFIGSWLR
jgi:hypothetical protein